MTKPLLIKGGIVLTLDKAGKSGVFDLFIRNGKISSIDYEGKADAKLFLSQNPGSQVIDANGKIIMPGLFNSRIVSSYSLCGMFLTGCNYENMWRYMSLNLIDKYLSDKVNQGRLSDIFELIYKRSVRCGETFVSEASHMIRKSVADFLFTDLRWIKQYFTMTAYDLKLVDDPGTLRGAIHAGFRADEDINSYAITSVKRTAFSNQARLIIDASLSSAVAESVMNSFGKSYINLLDENGMIGSSAVIVNPIHATEGELELIKEKGATVLLCASDYSLFAEHPEKIKDLISSGVKLIVGTGMSGTDILSELKFISGISGGNISNEELIRTAVTEPASVFGVSNVTGSVEKMKSADLIFLTLRDIRNAGGIADLDSESICWHILRYLSGKDITDVMIKGEFAYNSSAEDRQTVTRDAAKVAELSAMLYAAGKFKEFKDRKNRQSRVDKIELGQDSKQEVITEVFVDMTETGDYQGDGEFRILGQKEEEYTKPRDNDSSDKNTNLREIKSFDYDLNLLDDDDIQEDLPKLAIRLAPTKKAVLKPSQPVKVKEKPIEIDENLEDRKDKHEVEEPVAEVKKARMRFGFKEGE